MRKNGSRASSPELLGESVAFGDSPCVKVIDHNDGEPRLVCIPCVKYTGIMVTS